MGVESAAGPVGCYNTAGGQDGTGQKLRSNPEIRFQSTASLGDQVGSL